MLRLAACSDSNVCTHVEKWTGSTAAGRTADILIGLPAALIGLLVLGLVVRWVAHRVVDRIVSHAGEGLLPDRVGRLHLGRRGGENVVQVRDLMDSSRRVQRAKTMGDLLKSIITGLLVVVIGTMMLSQVGVNIAPIIASAGVIGIAVGFGAQSLVKDFLSGVFLIFEDQFGVGDVVDVGEASGTVEAVSLRVTRLRDINGTVWYVPNGEILRVGNKSQNWSRAVIDISVGYSEDLVRVQRVLHEVARSIWDDEDYAGQIIEEPEVTGVESLSADSVDLRVMVKTLPLRNWAIARELRQRIKTRFDAEGIEIPFAQRVVYHRDETAAGAGAAGPPSGGGGGTGD